MGRLKIIKISIKIIKKVGNDWLLIGINIII